ncbi:hypothetical protein Tco_0831143 [Tanacetum coccineum]
MRGAKYYARRNQKVVHNSIHSSIEWSSRVDEQNLVRKRKSNVGNYKHEVNETSESQALATRTFNRQRKHPVWHSDYVMESNVAYCLLTEDGEPSTLQEALNNLDASFWKEAMQEETESLYKNKT